MTTKFDHLLDEAGNPKHAALDVVPLNQVLYDWLTDLYLDGQGAIHESLTERYAYNKATADGESGLIKTLKSKSTVSLYKLRVVGFNLIMRGEVGVNAFGQLRADRNRTIVQWWKANIGHDVFRPLPVEDVGIGPDNTFLIKNVLSGNDRTGSDTVTEAWSFLDSYMFDVIDQEDQRYHMVRINDDTGSVVFKMLFC